MSTARAGVVPSSAAVSSNMSRHPRRDTRPELQVRRRLHAAGLRYRVHVPVPGLARRTIDVAFPRRRVAVFIDGCFWHGCSEHRTIPAANRAWWSDKIATNRRRDEETATHLRAQGWTVLRFWEHTSADEVAAAIREAVLAAPGTARRVRSVAGRT